MTPETLRARLTTLPYLKVGGQVHISELAKTVGLDEEGELSALLNSEQCREIGGMYIHHDRNNGMVRFFNASTPKPAPRASDQVSDVLNSRIAGGEASQGGPFARQRAAEEQDARSEQEWNSSADLRGEFSNLAAYKAYRSAEARGLVGPICHGGVVVRGEDVRRELGK